MKAPKLLPWVARKAGISDDLALKLWRRAAGETEERFGCCDGSDYHAASLRRFIKLAEDESGVAIAETTPGTPANWLWRHQDRMSQLNHVSAQNIFRLWQSNWGKVLDRQSTSA